MSQETATWLNQNVLIGFTSKRGNAWHYRESAQGAEPNHYEFAIPTETVRRRLFGWNFAEGTVGTEYLGASGFETITDPDRKTIVRPRGTFGPDDQGQILGVFKSGYQVHPYGEWLIDNVSTILDSGLSIGSAGILKGGGIAWVQCELDETVHTPEGVSFRPFITAATSVDGSLSSTYQTGAQLVVCDNTLAAAMGRGGSEAANRVKVRHSKNSLGRVQEVRDAIGVVIATADEFSAEIAELCKIDVSDAAWSRFVQAHVPMPSPDAQSTRGATMAANKRAELTQLWNNDNRVSPWKGTAFGVVQAVNTHAHHVQGVRGESRADRNALRTVKGEWSNLQADTIALLTKTLELV